MTKETRDSNGTLLADGDNVTLVEDLKVKGIRLTDNPEEVDCKAGGIKGLVPRSGFLKKA